MEIIEAPSLRATASRVVETDIPARLDSLRWSAFHTRVVTALGITWILDGLEVTLAGALSGALKDYSLSCPQGIIDKPVDEAVRHDVPDDWGASCGLYVTGTPGTTFEVREYKN